LIVLPSNYFNRPDRIILSLFQAFICNKTNLFIPDFHPGITPPDGFVFAQFFPVSLRGIGFRDLSPQVKSHLSENFFQPSGDTKQENLSLLKPLKFLPVIVTLYAE